MPAPISNEVLLYTEILGIPRSECPPDHYRLLDLVAFESDRSTIEKAVAQRLAQVQAGNHGTYGDYMAKQLREVANVLLNPTLKEAYDKILFEKKMSSSISGASTPPPAAPPAPQFPPPAYNHYAPPAPSYSPPPAPTYPPAPQPTYPAAPAASTRPAPQATTPRSSTTRRTRRTGGRVPIYLRLIVIGLAVLSHIGLFWFVSQHFLGSNDQDLPATARSEPPKSTHPKPTPNAEPTKPTPTIQPPNDESKEVVADTDEEQLSLDEVVVPPGMPEDDLTLPDSVSSNPFEDTTSSRPRRSPVLVGDEDASDNSGGEEDATPEDFGPLSPLDPEVVLPPIAAETSVPEGATILGLVESPAVESLKLLMDSSAADLPSGQRYQIDESTSASDLGTRTWDISLTPDNGPLESRPSVPEKPVAHLILDETGALKFYWNTLVSASEAEQLPNTLLLCACDDYRRSVALRKADELPAVGLMLDGQDLGTSLSLTTPPKVESLWLEVDLGNSNLAVKSEPDSLKAKLGGSALLLVGETGEEIEAEIRVVCRQAEDSQLQVKVAPKYRKAEDGKLADLTGPELVEQIARLQRLLSRETNELAAAHANLPAYLSAMEKIQKTTPRNKEEVGVLHRAGIQAQGHINQCRSTIKANTRTMPASYEALNRIIEAAKLARRLDGTATVQYTIFAKTTYGRIELARGTVTPESLTQSDTFNFLDNTPGPPGIWIALQPFQFVELTSGGSVRVTDASGKKSLGSGTWNQSGGTVNLTSSAGRESYTLHNGIGMTSVNGKMLFRKF